MWYATPYPLFNGAKQNAELIICESQLVLDYFPTSYDPTLEDCYRKQVVLDGEACILEYLDTSGREESMPLRQQWIRASDGVMVVYNICSRSSFEHISEFHKQVEEVKGVKAFPICVVGN